MATFQVFNSHMWLIAVMLDSTQIEHAHHCRRYYWIGLFYAANLTVVWALILSLFNGWFICPSRPFGKDTLVQASWSHLISAQIVSFYFRTLFLKVTSHETCNLLHWHPPVHLYIHKKWVITGYYLAYITCCCEKKGWGWCKLLVQMAQIIT